MSNHRKLTLAQKLKISRRQIGLSQKQMGSALKLSDKAISSYEVGRATPNLETLRNISVLTNKPVAYFMDDEETDDLQITMRLKVIERELSAIKALLQRPTTKS